jgi:ATF/CREB family transcription factor
MGSSTGPGGRGESTSPKRSRNPSPPRQDPQPESKIDADPKAEQPATTDAETTKPLAPPPRPAQQPSGNSPDYFSNPVNASLSLEPNPFEQSFGGAPETPGGTKLPSVAALTSPSSLLPGSGVTPFAWGGGSLRTGPLSPAMLSGPTNDYFSSDHIRGSFPTPNESSLRTGLTPGGSGSMFPAPSPNSALFALAGSTAPTPGIIDFHRTAVSAAAKREQKSQTQTQQSVTSQPQSSQEMSNGVPPLKTETAKPSSSGPFDPHDNDAANGLFLLAQGRNGTQTQTQQQYPVIPPPHIHNHAPAPPATQAMSTSPQMNGNASIAGSSARGVSEAASAMSDESEIARPNTRAKGKRNTGGGANSRRKAEDNAGKGPANKKAKTNGGGHNSANGSFDDMDHSDDDMANNEGGGKVKMTDDEKRKNFLERNRVAALKCRQRKKQWLANLQNKVELYSTENDNLTAQISALREEVVNLKTLLLAHKDCPVTQQQGLHGAFALQQPPMEPFNQPMNPYGMAGPPLPGQPVLTGQAVNRRFS